MERSCLGGEKVQVRVVTEHVFAQSGNRVCPRLSMLLQQFNDTGRTPPSAPSWTVLIIAAEETDWGAMDLSTTVLVVV